MVNQQPSSSRSVCKVNTQDPENFDEELKSLVTAWLTFPSFDRHGSYGDSSSSCVRGLRGHLELALLRRENELKERNGRVTFSL